MLAPELRFVERTKVVFAGRTYTFFGGNDYHRLSSHPDVVQTLADAAAAHGLSTAGSRLTTGNHPVLVELERSLARFLGVEAALTVSSGYLTNLALLEAIGADFHRVYLDATSHSSVAEPCRRFPAEAVHRFRHLDPEDLAARLRSSLRPRERPLVLTDGVFPSNGDLAPVPEYLSLVRDSGGAVLVDDAHAIGVVGATGKGSAEERGLEPGAVLQTGTLSKALGAFGGLIAVSTDVARRITESSLAFSGATGIPPPIAAAALRSIEILADRPGAHLRVPRADPGVEAPDPGPRVRGSGLLRADRVDRIPGRGASEGAARGPRRPGGLPAVHHVPRGARGRALPVHVLERALRDRVPGARGGAPVRRGVSGAAAVRPGRAGETCRGNLSIDLGNGTGLGLSSDFRGPFRRLRPLSRELGWR